jgi:arylsulfatase A-like enzyme
MDRRRFLQTAGTLAAGAAIGDVGGLAKLPRWKPNFVIVLADDMGFSDAGCFGGEIDTPTIDSLARGGTKFNNMYSTGRCGPSRNCLLTGMYAQQTAADVMTPGKIPDYTHFLPEYLKAQGYRSYHSGKWHFRLTPRVNGVGFDRTYTMLDESRFFTQWNHQLDEVTLPPPDQGYYSTTAIADYAVDFLKDHDKNHQNDPFFLFLAFHAPHFPLQAPQADIDRYHDRFGEGWDVIRSRRHKRMLDMGLINCPLAPMEPAIFPSWNLPVSELQSRIGPGEVGRAVAWSSLTEEQKRLHRIKMSIHAAMITRLDTETGKVMRQLKAMNMFDDTVVIFLSDNGASAEEIIRGDGHDPSAPPGSAKTFLSIGPGWATAADTPFRLHKSWVHEGGIASPMVVSWPNGVQKGGQLRTSPCHFINILPTIVELAGGNPNGLAPNFPGHPGKSLVPAIRNATPVDRGSIYFNHNKNRALRNSDWKLVAKGAEGPWELYDMRTDRCESRDLIASQPERGHAMAAEWKQQDELWARQRDAAPATTKRMMPISAGAMEQEPNETGSPLTQRATTATTNIFNPIL